MTEQPQQFQVFFFLDGAILRTLTMPAPPRIDELVITEEEDTPTYHRVEMITYPVDKSTTPTVHCHLSKAAVQRFLVHFHLRGEIPAKHTHHMDTPPRVGEGIIVQETPDSPASFYTVTQVSYQLTPGRSAVTRAICIMEEEPS